MRHTSGFTSKSTSLIKFIKILPCKRSFAPIAYSGLQRSVTVVTYTIFLFLVHLHPQFKLIANQLRELCICVDDSRRENTFAVLLEYDRHDTKIKVAKFFSVLLFFRRHSMVDAGCNE